MGLPEDTDEIVLRCSDDQTRTVQYAVAKMSGTIKNLVEGIFTMYCIIYPLITTTICCEYHLLMSRRLG